MIKQFLSLIICGLIANYCLAQNTITDTVTVLNYNINNLGFASTGNCPLKGSPVKFGYLKTIVQYNQPDIIAFEKINGTPTSFSTDTIRLRVLDSICSGCYANAPYTNVSGYQKVNSLFYKTTKFGFLGTTTIYSADNSISDINLHKLYYKSPSLATFHDTAFLNVIVMHNTSGNGSASTRATQMNGVVKWFKKNITQPMNCLFVGDFNTQTSSEACFQSLISAADTNVKFYDPPNQLGNWSANPTSFAKYLTQSSRGSTDPGDCSATGGFNDRLDHILCSNPIMKGYKNVKYVANSYTVIGQDGLHTSKAINASPTNVSAPTNVINALFYMSEHLPITIKLAISYKNAPLPATLSYFKVENLSNQHKLLQWQFADKDFSDYTSNIEYSYNATDFIVLAKIKQHQLIQQAFTDTLIHHSPIVYYRLKLMEQNGNFQYSNVISINNNQQSDKIVFSVFPNPFTDKIIVSSNSILNKNGMFSITDGYGRVLYTQTLLGNAKQWTIEVGNHLSKGMYIVNISFDKDTSFQKIIKAN